MPLAEDMIQFLTDDGMAASFFDSFVPMTKTGRVLIVTATPGRDPDLTHESPDKRLDRPRFQLAGRDPDPEVAEALVREGLNRLARVRNQTINGTRYLSVHPVNGPSPLNRDEQERLVYVGNMEVHQAVDFDGLVT